MITDLIASSFVLAGLYLYGRKHLAGPILSMIGCFLWFLVGLTTQMYVLALLNAILFTVNSYNAVVWAAEVKRQNRDLIPPSGDEQGPGPLFRRLLHRP